MVWVMPQIRNSNSAQRRYNYNYRIINYLRQGSNVFARVCLSVCLLAR